MLLRSLVVYWLAGWVGRLAVGDWPTVTIVVLIALS
jgi:hypothetical protein